MITSSNNSNIKNIIKLQKSSKYRREQNKFIVEGIRIFREIPREMLCGVYITNSFFDYNESLLDDISYEIVSDNVFKEISDTTTPQGVLAVVEKKKYSLDYIINEKEPLILVLENLQDPGNLGTIMRSGEACGVSGIIMSNDTVDIYNPKVIRATMGAIFRVPFVYCDNLIDVTNRLKEKKINIYAAHLNGDSFYGCDYCQPTAFLIGNEGNGLTDELSGEATKLIKIPMKGKVESLNAAIAATVLMYEAQRQRIV